MIDNIQLTIIWDKIKEYLKSELNPHAYEQYIINSKVIKSNDKKIFVEVESDKIADRFRNSYMSFIEDAIELVSEELEYNLKGYSFVFVVTEKEVENDKRDTIQNISESGYNQLNDKYTFDNFVAGKSNDLAYSAALSIASSKQNLYNPFFLYGGVGLGKTHIVQAIGHAFLKKYKDFKVKYVTSEKFTNDFIEAIRNQKIDKFNKIYREADLLIIDDVQFISGKTQTQENFFHTFNYLLQNDKHIVLTCDTPPSEIDGLEERLTSRFEQGMVADIQNPDFELRLAILRNLANKENIEINDEILEFIADNIRSNIRRLEGAFKRLIMHSSHKGIHINDMNIALIKDILKDLINSKKDIITPEYIKNYVGDYFKIQVEKMETSIRTKDISDPRKICMALISEFTDLPLKQIGNLFGGMDHTTVLYAKKIFSDKKFDINKKICKDYSQLKQKLEEIKNS